MEYSNLFVVLMGMGVVFLGLICIILLTMAMGAVLQDRKKKKPENSIENEWAAAEQEQKITPEKMAMILSVLSEEANTTPYGLNIIEIKKVSCL